ncbi:MAG: hypothetical protein ACI9EF_001201 [Pseudohongiellaceae bacterium]|jgi:hypothetical protein
MAGENPTRRLVIRHRIPLAAPLAMMLALLLPCCADAVDPHAAKRILLLGGNLFAEGDRCAQVLNDMVAVSGVLGDAHFEVLAAPGASPEELIDLLRGAPDARAVIAIVGDLSVLRGVDTNKQFPQHKKLSSRVVNNKQLDHALTALQTVANERGMDWVLATHPLGLQGRIEVPELVAVAEHLRDRGATLDLATAFAARERELLFTNDVDVLDEYGHDALAETILLALLDDDAPMRAEQPGQTSARRELSALLAWASGDDARFRWSAHRALQEPAVDAAQATRQAAISTAISGLTPQTRRLWQQIDSTSAAAEIPGLAAGRLLSAGNPQGHASDVPTTQGLAALAAAMKSSLGNGDRQGGNRSSAVLAAADDWVAASPQHASAWLGLEFAVRISRQRKSPAKLAAIHLQAYQHIVAPERWEQLSQSWPENLSALPALAILERTFLAQLPAGPSLHATRRASRQGKNARSLALFDKATRLLALPENWVSERVRIAALARSAR